MKALADNDVLLKGACFGILDALIGHERASVGLLGAAKYVLPKRMAKARLQKSAAEAIAVLESFLRDGQVVEPTDDEQEIAAALEVLAQREGLPFDSGESQLAAVLIMRDIPELLTGDKRAIAALERLLDVEARLDGIRGRVRCLEQLVRVLIDRTCVADVRSAVCAEPHVDRALAMCFSCSSNPHSSENVLDGLASYIADVRRTAGRILAGEP